MQGVFRGAAVGGFSALLVLFAASDSEAQLRGDADAIAAVERMLDALGGAELWARNRTLELHYQGWSKSVEGPVVERAWRHLAEPEQRIELERTGTDLVVVFTATQGWRAEGTDVSEFDAQAMARHRLFWPKDFYTLIHRFAVEDPDLWVEQFDDGRIVAYSETHGELGWWEIAGDGAIIRWGTLDMGEPLEYVYGPMRDFGAGVRFPAWGASLDGGWRFEYSRVELSASPMDPRMLARPSGDA